MYEYMPIILTQKKSKLKEQFNTFQLNIILKLFVHITYKLCLHEYSKFFNI